MKSLLVAGCGDLGMRLGERLKDGDWQVHGLRRRPDRLPPFIRGIGADLLTPSSLEKIPQSWDAVIYQATPGERTPDAYREAYVDGLSNLLQRVRTQRLIFVSSTAVYGQDQGEWVDEDSATEPQAFSGRILLEAEARAREHGGLVVRFSGIYGPGRDYLIRTLKSGRARCRRDPPQWTNRIHADDCAAVLDHLLNLAQAQPLYLASDSMPTPRCEVLTWLAKQLDLPGPKADSESSGQGKRIRNQRLTSAGFEFQYPDYQTGYRTLLP